MLNDRLVPDDEESIIDDIGDDSYTDEDFEEEDIPPLEVSSARRNRPPTATRRTDGPPGVAHVSAGPERTHSSSPSIDDERSQYGDDFVDEERDEDLLQSTPRATAGGGPIPSVTLSRAATLTTSPGAGSAALRSDSVSDDAGDEYDDAETFDALFDTATQSHHQMFDIASALLASTNVSSSLGNANDDPLGSSSPGGARTDLYLLTPFQRRQQAISKKRAELLGALYTAAARVGDTFFVDDATATPQNGTTPNAMRGMLQALRDFATSPLFSVEEGAELLLGPIITGGPKTDGSIEVSVLATIESVLRYGKLFPSNVCAEELDAASAAILSTLRYKDALLLILITDATNNSSDIDEGQGKPSGFPTMAQQWGWLSHLFSNASLYLHDKVIRCAHQELLPLFVALSMFERCRAMFDARAAWSVLLDAQQWLLTTPEDPHVVVEWVDAVVFWADLTRAGLKLLVSGQLRPPPSAAPGVRGLRQLVAKTQTKRWAGADGGGGGGGVLQTPTAFRAPVEVLHVVAKDVLCRHVLPLLHCCAYSSAVETFPSFVGRVGMCALSMVDEVSPLLSCAPSAMGEDADADVGAATCQLFYGLHALLARCCRVVPPPLHRGATTDGASENNNSAVQLVQAVTERIPAVEVMSPSNALEEVVTHEAWITLFDDLSSALKEIMHPSAPQALQSVLPSVVQVLSVLMAATTHYFNVRVNGNLSLRLAVDLKALVDWLPRANDGPVMSTPTLVLLKDVVVTVNSLIASGWTASDPSIVDHVVSILNSSVALAAQFVHGTGIVPGSNGGTASPLMDGNKSFKDTLEGSQRRLSTMLPLAASAVFPPPQSTRRKSDVADASTGELMYSPFFDNISRLSTALSVAALALSNLLHIFRASTNTSGHTDEALPVPFTFPTEPSETGNFGAPQVDHVGPTTPPQPCNQNNTHALRGVALEDGFELLESLLFPSDFLRSQLLHHAPLDVAANGSEESPQELADRVIVNAVLLVTFVLKFEQNTLAVDAMGGASRALHFVDTLEDHVTLAVKSWKSSSSRAGRRSFEGHTHHAAAGSMLPVAPALHPLLSEAVTRIVTDTLPSVLSVEGVMSSSDAPMQEGTAAMDLVNFALSISRLMGYALGSDSVQAAPICKAVPPVRVCAKLFRLACQRLARLLHADASAEAYRSTLQDLATGLLTAPIWTALHLQPRAEGSNEGGTASTELTPVNDVLHALTALLGDARNTSVPHALHSIAREVIAQCEPQRVLTNVWRQLQAEGVDVMLVSNMTYCETMTQFVDALFAPFCHHEAPPLSDAAVATPDRLVMQDLEHLWRREVLPWHILEMGHSMFVLPALQCIQTEHDMMTHEQRRGSLPLVANNAMPDAADVERELSTVHEEAIHTHYDHTVFVERFQLLVEREALTREQYDAQRVSEWRDAIEQPHQLESLRRACTTTFLRGIEASAVEAVEAQHAEVVATAADPIVEQIEVGSVVSETTNTSENVEARHHLQVSQEHELMKCGDEESSERMSIGLAAVAELQTMLFDALQATMSVAKEQRSQDRQPQPSLVDTTSPTALLPPPIAQSHDEAPMDVAGMMDAVPTALFPQEVVAVDEQQILNRESSNSSMSSSSAEKSVRAAMEFELAMEAAAIAVRPLHHDGNAAATALPDNSEPTDHVNATTSSSRASCAEEQRRDDGVSDVHHRHSCFVGPLSATDTSFADANASSKSLLIQLETLVESLSILPDHPQEPRGLTACLGALRDATVRRQSAERTVKSRAAIIMDDLRAVKCKSIAVIRAIEQREELLSELHDFVVKFERTPHFFTAGLTDSILSGFITNMRTASIHVVECTSAWRAAQREYYARWDEGCGDANRGSLCFSPNTTSLAPNTSTQFSSPFSQTWNSIPGDGSATPPQHSATAPSSHAHTKAPTVFLYKGVHYLEKMKHDLGFLTLSPLGDFLHIDVEKNLVLVSKKRIVDTTITEPMCRGRNFFARLSAPKGTLPISRAAGHLDPDEYGIKELQKATEDERSMNVWFRGQTAVEQQVIAPRLRSSDGVMRKAQVFNMFDVVVPHNWRASMVLRRMGDTPQPLRPLSAALGPTDQLSRCQTKVARPSSASASREGARSPLDMFSSLQQTSTPAADATKFQGSQESMKSTSKIRNKLKGIHAGVPSAADHVNRLSRRHPLQRFVAVERDIGVTQDASTAGGSNHPAGRAAAAAAGLRAPQLTSPLTGCVIKTRRGSSIGCGRYSISHASSTLLSSSLKMMANGSTPMASSRTHWQPIPAGWDGVFALCLAILFYRKLRIRAHERCSATRIQRWFRRCRLQAMCGKLIEDALAADSELMMWIVSLAASHRNATRFKGIDVHHAHRHSWSSASTTNEEDEEVNHQHLTVNASVPRYCNALQLFRFYSVAAAKIQRQYRSFCRRRLIVTMISKLIAVLKLQHWVRNVLGATRLRNAARLIRVGRRILKWANACRLRTAERAHRRRVRASIRIERWYRICVAKAELHRRMREEAAAINMQRVVRGWRGRRRAATTQQIATVLKFIKAKLWYRYLAQNLLYMEVSRRLLLALQRSQSQKELARRREAKAQQLRIYLKIDEAIVQRRAVSRIFAVYKGWATRRTLVEAIAHATEVGRIDDDAITDSVHSTLLTRSGASSTAVPLHPPRRGTVLETQAVAATWSLAKQLVGEYTPIVLTLQCFFRKTLARKQLERLRRERRIRDVYFSSWQCGARLLMQYRNTCARKAASVFLASLRRSQERRAQERRRQEEHQRQVAQHHSACAAIIQSCWRMFTTRQAFLEACTERMAWREARDAEELVESRLVGLQRCVRTFLRMQMWRRVRARRRDRAAVRIQKKWRKERRTLCQLEEAFTELRRKSGAAFKIQVWFRSCVASRNALDWVSDDDDYVS